MLVCGREMGYNIKVCGVQILVREMPEGSLRSPAHREG